MSIPDIRTLPAMCISQARKLKRYCSAHYISYNNIRKARQIIFLIASVTNFVYISYIKA